MTVAAQFQDIVFRGGNAFFGIHTNDIQNDYERMEEVGYNPDASYIEKGIVNLDQALIGFLEYVFQFFTILFIPKPKLVAEPVAANGNVSPISSSRKLVDKFNAQYQSQHNQNTPKNRSKPKRKSMFDYIELGLGIIVYGLYKLVTKGSR